MPERNDEEDLLRSVALQNAQSILHARRLAEEALRKQSEWLRVTLASIGDAVISTDAAGRVTFMNGVAESLTGWSQAEASTEPLQKVFHIINETTRAVAENPADRILRAGTIVGLANHTILIAKDGTERHIDDSAAPIRTEQGEIAGVVLVFRDVTERWLNGKQLLKQDAETRRLLELNQAILANMGEGLYTVDTQGLVTYVNPAAERMFGWTCIELMGRKMHDVTHYKYPDGRPFPAEECAGFQVLRRGAVLTDHEDFFIRKDGSFFPVSYCSAPLRSGNETVGLVVAFRDTTEQKKTEDDRQKLVTLAENSTDFIGMCDMAGQPFFINRAGLEMVGLEGIEQARRISVRDFFFPEDQSRILDVFFPAVMQRGSGEIEVRFRHFKSGNALWMLYKVFALTDPDGQPVGLATVSRDITQRRQMEDHLRQLAADLSESARRKDEFLATLAHELRNPLAPMSNGLQMMRLAGIDGAVAEQARTMMERQLGQLVRLVDDLMDVSRISRGKIELRKEHVPLAAVVKSALETSRPLIEKMGHKLVISLPNDPVLIDADLTRLAQALTNLLNNAAKYTNSGGHISLTAALRGRDVMIVVKDDGIGIAADQLPRIFEMFSQIDHSLEKAQGGLGIGLTLVKRLVELHGGSIVAKSAGAGQGAEFVVQLPLAVVLAEKAAPFEPEEKTSAPRISLRILVVDDNLDGANSLSSVLKALGHDTRTAYDGEAAVTAAAEFQPSVVLLDIGLPKLNGYEVCRRIRQQPGGDKVVIIAQTGWGQDEDRQRAEEAGFDYHLVKPVDMPDLLEILAGVPDAAQK